MSCRKCIYPALSIAESDGVTTITITTDVLGELCVNEELLIAIDTSIPNTARCNRISITDGTHTRIVAKCNQYWRPCQLICNSVLVLENKADPNLLVFKRGVRR